MEVIYSDDTNIAGAIDTIDVESMAQHIYFGPQAEIMEKLAQFNSRYLTNLSVTKTFRWSPGTYDKIAQLMMKLVGFKRRASGMYNYLSREDWYWTNGRRNIQSDLRNMDNILYELRYQGVQWLEDPSILVERKEAFKNYLSEKFEAFIELTNKMDKITPLNVVLYNDGYSTLNSYKLVINLCLHPDEIQIYNANRGGTPIHIQNLPVEMDLLIKLELYPLQMMVNERYSRFSIHSCGKAAPYDERGRLHFPYISGRHRNTPYSATEGWGTICYGDDSTDINNALNNFDLSAYAMLLINWMGRYTQITNPYNNIKTMYHGEPKWLTDDYRAIFGTNNWDACNYQPSGNDDYCDTNECALRHQCEYYKQAHPEPISPEQAEQLTLQWATRMGGIGTPAAPTVTHSVNDEGEPTSTTTDLPIQGDREQFDPEALVEELRNQEEEDRINAAMDAEETEE